VPVTAKFSKEFYDKLGHEVADELVDWFNAVDATYRSDFKDLFDTSFGRLEAILDSRLVQFEAKLDRRFVDIEAKWDKRFVGLEAKWDKRFLGLEAKIDRRFADVDARFAQQSVEINARFVEFGAQVDVKLERLEKRLLRWMFVFWVGSLGTVITLLRLFP